MAPSSPTGFQRSKFYRYSQSQLTEYVNSEGLILLAAQEYQRQRQDSEAPFTNTKLAAPLTQQQWVPNLTSRQVRTAVNRVRHLRTRDGLRVQSTKVRVPGYIFRYS